MCDAIPKTGEEIDEIIPSLRKQVSDIREVRLPRRRLDDVLDGNTEEREDQQQDEYEDGGS